MSRTCYREGKAPAFSFCHFFKKTKGWSGLMFLKMFFIAGLSVCLFGCAHQPQGTYQRVETDFLKVGKIAVIKFNGAEDAGSGIEAASRLALAFAQKGYSVVDVGNVLSLNEQEKLYSGVLTPEIKAKFRNSGIGSIVMGTIHGYSCVNYAPGIFVLFHIDAYRTSCQVALSVKMIKLDTGEILWGASRYVEDAGSDVNAGRVLRTLIQELDSELPAGSAKQPAK